MAKKTNVKPDEIVNNKEQVDIIETKPAENKVETQAEIANSFEVVLKTEECNKDVHIVFTERGKYVEFHKGKAVVNASTKAKLEEIGVI